MVRAPDGELRPVQMKARPMIDWSRYGGHQVWMLFPDPAGEIPGRIWFLIEHDELLAWMKERHAAAPGWNGTWSDPHVGVDLARFLQPFVLNRGSRPKSTTLAS